MSGSASRTGPAPSLLENPCHAKDFTAGRALPHPWRGVRVRMSGHGYAWMVSSVPPKPGRSHETNVTNMETQ